MSRIVFDIETFGSPFDDFDQVQQDYLMKYAETEQKREEVIQKLNLHPLTAQVVAIGVLNPDSNAGKVLYQGEADERLPSGEGTVEFRSGNEKDILAWFWECVKPYDQFITFNGRSFDCPFLMLRSAILGIRPTRNLVSSRYDSSRHCDLLEQLTFYGAIRKFNFDFYCKAFGIKSPKSGGVSGSDVGPMFRERRFREIADYCLADVRATTELFRRWNEYLNLKD